MGANEDLAVVVLDARCCGIDIFNTQPPTVGMPCAVPLRIKPCPFLSRKLPPCSIMRPTATKGIAMNVVNVLTVMGFSSVNRRHSLTCYAI
jgi:hypothetical protein